MTLDETFLSYLGGINTNDLIINILDTNRIDNYEPQLNTSIILTWFWQVYRTNATKTSCFRVLSTNIQSIKF